MIVAMIALKKARFDNHQKQRHAGYNSEIGDKHRTVIIGIRDQAAGMHFALRGEKPHDDFVRPQGDVVDESVQPQNPVIFEGSKDEQITASADRIFRIKFTDQNKERDSDTQAETREKSCCPKI